jgi:hypothetical protein
MFTCCASADSWSCCPIDDGDGGDDLAKWIYDDGTAASVAYPTGRGARK